LRAEIDVPGLVAQPGLLQQLNLGDRDGVALAGVGGAVGDDHDEALIAGPAAEVPVAVPQGGRRRGPSELGRDLAE